MKNRLGLSAALFTAAASFIYMVNAGIRNNFGIMLSAIAENAGLAFASVSFVLAVGQLCFGVTQPFSGVAAQRYGNRRTLLAGATAPVTLWMCRGTPAARTEEPAAERADRPSFAELFSLAGRSRDYRFIVAGFFTCGFHMALITNHLATEIMSCGFTYAQSSYAFSIYGIATIAGALISGALSARLSMKDLLGTLYGLRAVGILVYLLLPKTMAVICGYITLLGLTGAATVTPVSGLCRRLFGASGVTILYGIAFFAHQTGGFLSAWLGGGVLHAERGLSLDLARRRRSVRVCGGRQLSDFCTKGKKIPVLTGGIHQNNQKPCPRYADNRRIIFALHLHLSSIHRQTACV